MFFLPGWLIELITFPGVVVHEIGHRIFCHLTGVPVYDVRYYKFRGAPSGYVIHGEPPTLGAAFLISFGPLFLNTSLCSLLTFTAFIPTLILKDTSSSAVSVFLMWIGFSIGMHAFPSNHDADQFTNRAHDGNGQKALILVAQALALILQAANFLRIIWFDLIYAILVSAVLPLAFGVF